MTPDTSEYDLWEMNPDFLGVYTSMPNQCCCAFFKIVDVTRFNCLNLILTHPQELAHRFKG